MAGSEYYNHTTYPSTGAAGSSAALRAELDLIEAGFGKLPDLSGNGSKIVAINSGATAMEAISTTGTGSVVRATSPTLVTPILGTPTSGNATNLTNTIAPQTTAATSKATPVDADEIPIADSAASNGLKKLTWSNLKATLKTYFDSLYLPISARPSGFLADNNNVNIATIPDSTWTRVALSTERYDTNNEFASGTFTAKSAGIHEFYFQWSGAAPVANNAMRCRLYKNGTEFAEGRIILVSGNQQIVSVYYRPNLAIGDTVDAYVFHDRGTNQEVHGSVLFTYFCGGFTGIAA